MLVSVHRRVSMATGTLYIVSFSQEEVQQVADKYLLLARRHRLDPFNEKADSTTIRSLSETKA